MDRTTLLRLRRAALFLLGAWAAYTQNPSEGQLTVNKVKDDLYEMSATAETWPFTSPAKA